MTRNIIVTIIMYLVSMTAMANWGMVGAGNATCKNWNSSNQNGKTEILSWMAGFGSALNLEYSSEKQPALKLKLLTYEYLTNEINNTCSNIQNSEKRMSSILLEVLREFPREK